MRADATRQGSEAPNESCDVQADRGACGVQGLPALLTVQALGAFNDNVLKTIVTLLLVGRAAGAGEGSAYLSLTGVAFVTPYLLFSGFAGYLADRFSKRSVIVVAKCVELGIVVASFAALLLDRVDLMIATLFMMAMQSSFLSPAKYGILPEMLPASSLSRANGLMESTRYLAVILGSVSGALLLAAPDHRQALVCAVLIGTAGSGILASLWVARVPASGKAVAFRLNPWHEIGVGLRRIAETSAVQFAVVGITCIEFLGCLVLLDVVLLAKTVMGLGDAKVGVLGASVGLGAALGSYVCGRLSGSRVRPGLSFFGVFGVAVSLMALSLAADFREAALLIFVLGVAGGMAVVPLYALLQKTAGGHERGQIMATNNFLNMAGVLLASGGLWLLNDVFGMTPDGVLLWCGIVLLLLTGVALRRWPEYGHRSLIRALLGIRSVGSPG